MKTETKRAILEHLRDRARELRRNSTPAERKLWEALRYDRCQGLRFLRQQVIGPYIVDFYCAKARLVIEVDGSIHELPDIHLQDTLRQHGLEQEHGLRVLRLSNETVLSSTPDQLRQKIDQFLISPSSQ